MQAAEEVRKALSAKRAGEEGSRVEHPPGRRSPIPAPVAVVAAATLGADAVNGKEDVVRGCELLKVLRRIGINMPSFTDLDTPSGVAKLNDFLASASFVDGALPTKADVALMKSIPRAPDAADAPHVARWYKNIASYSALEVAAFSGEAPKEKTDEDFGDDLFGDTDSDDEEALKAQEERAQAALAAKAVRDAKKAEAGKKVVAKSSVVLEVKPWESDTDMAAMEASVRGIDMPGLTWGASKLQEIGYGIKKLVIMCTIIDELVPSTDDITEKIEAFEDYVQSCDIAAFNKL